MSMKIKISYTEESEANEAMRLLQPLAGCFKIKKSDGTPPYKHIYFNPTKHAKRNK